MLGFSRGNGLEFYPALYLNHELLLVLAVSCLVAAAGGPALKKVFARLQGGVPGKYRPRLAVAGRWLSTLLLVGLLLAGATRLAMATYNPFIYFRF